MTDTILTITVDEEWVNVFNHITRLPDTYKADEVEVLVRQKGKEEVPLHELIRFWNEFND
jgi:hypothetical protein